MFLWLLFGLSFLSFGAPVDRLCELKAIQARRLVVTEAFASAQETPAEFNNQSKILTNLGRHFGVMTSSERQQTLDLLEHFARTQSDPVKKTRLLRIFTDSLAWLKNDASAIRLARFALLRSSPFLGSGAEGPTVTQLLEHNGSEAFLRRLRPLLDERTFEASELWALEVELSLLPDSFTNEIPTVLLRDWSKPPVSNAAARKFVRELLIVRQNALGSKFLNRRLFSLIGRNLHLKQQEKMSLVLNVLAVFQALGGRLAYEVGEVTRDGSLTILGGSGYRYFYLIGPDSEGAPFYHVTFTPPLPLNAERWRRDATSIYRAAPVGAD